MHAESIQMYCKTIRVSLSNDAEDWVAVVLVVTHLCHDLAILGELEVLGQLFCGGNMSVSRIPVAGHLLAWFFLIWYGLVHSR